AVAEEAVDPEAGPAVAAGTAQRHRRRPGADGHRHRRRVGSPSWWDEADQQLAAGTRSEDPGATAGHREGGAAGAADGARSDRRRDAGVVAYGQRRWRCRMA